MGNLGERMKTIKANQLETLKLKRAISEMNILLTRLSNSLYTAKGKFSEFEDISIEHLTGRMTRAGYDKYVVNVKVEGFLVRRICK